MILPMVLMLDVVHMASVLLKGRFIPMISWIFSPDIVQIIDSMHRWDPATGLGTPNYPKMKKFFLSLP